MICVQKRRFRFRLLASATATTTSAFISLSWLEQYTIANPFIEPAGIEAVTSGQVNHFGRVREEGNWCFLFCQRLHPESSDLLVQPGKTIEQ